MYEFKETVSRRRGGMQPNGVFETQLIQNIVCLPGREPHSNRCHQRCFVQTKNAPFITGVQCLIERRIQRVQKHMAATDWQSNEIALLDATLLGHINATHCSWHETKEDESAMLLLISGGKQLCFAPIPHARRDLHPRLGVTQFYIVPLIDERSNCHTGKAASYIPVVKDITQLSILICSLNAVGPSRPAPLAACVFGLLWWHKGVANFTEECLLSNKDILSHNRKWMTSPDNATTQT